MASVFISYCHADQELRGQLQTHLALLRRQGYADIWTDHCIRPGEDFESTISTALEEADIILLLVSPDFINSEYCYGVEMKRALERAATGEAEVVPVILRPCDWMTSDFGRMKALPTDGVPIVKFPSRDDGFFDVVKQLREMLMKKASSSTSVTAAASPQVRAQGATSQAAAVRSLPAEVLVPTKRSSDLILPRSFTDLERAQFVADGYKEVLEYFINSLAELEKRNSHIKTNLQVITGASFTASIYNDGKKVAACGVRRGGIAGANGITYVSSDDPHLGANTANETMTIAEDKYALGWKPMFGGFMTSREQKLLTHTGAADHLFEMLMQPLRR